MFVQAQCRRGYLKFTSSHASSKNLEKTYLSLTREIKTMMKLLSLAAVAAVATAQNVELTSRQNEVEFRR